MKRILIATVTEADTCSASFCISLAQSVKVGLGAGVDFLPVAFSANGNWSMAFNQAVTLAWQEGLDGFLCISPRVTWQPQSLLELINSKHDAVAIPVATKGGFDVSLGEIARLQEDANGEIKVLGASLDFLYLSPYAVNQLCTTHPMVTYKNQDIKLILQSGDIYNTYADPSDILAYRLIEQGIEMWVNARHTAHRQDLVDYTASFSQILESLKTNG